jgi:hypothetical protein
MAKQQRILTLAFLRPSPDDHWVNHLAANMSTHPFCHVELYFEGLQQSFSIMWGETAGFRPKNLSNPNYTLVSLTVSVKEHDASLEFCRSVCSQGIGFDNRGMWLSWIGAVATCSVCDIPSQKKGATFCSKIITEALQFGELREVEALRPCTVTPSRLYECVMHSSRMACNSVPFKRQALVMFSTLT